MASYPSPSYDYAARKGAPETAWWTADKGSTAAGPHVSVWAKVSDLDTEQRYRTELNKRHLRLYAGKNVAGLGIQSYARETGGGAKDRFSLNVIRSCIDTLASKITKNRPRPLFLTTRGNFSQQARAKKLSQFTQGIFYGCDMYDLAPMVFICGGVFGTGFLHPYRRGTQIKLEYVFPEELKWDDAESKYGAPGNLYRVKNVSREVLIEQFPECKTEIAACEEDRDDDASHRPTTQLRVIEAWHLPSGPDAGDGRHTISLKNCTLVDEEWERETFPFIRFHWQSPLLGYSGQGLAELLTGTQVEINRLALSISESQRRLGVPWIYVKTGSKVAPSHLRNQIGAIINYTGDTPPQVVTHTSAPRDVVEQLDRLYNRAYEIAGISQLSATSQKPTGLNSGKALREYNDIETERFMMLGQAYENFFMDTARELIVLAKEIDEELREEGDKDGFVATYRGKNFMERIRWQDVDLENDQYEMQIFPVSQLPNTPSGRLDTIQEMMQAGLIDRDTGLQLLDFPDLEGAANQQLAAVELIQQVMERFLDGGEYIPPDPHMNLELGVKMMRNALLRARIDGAPESVQESFRDWLLDAQNILTPPQDVAPMPGAAPQPPAPMASPEAAPTSPLLPNVPGGGGAPPPVMN